MTDQEKNEALAKWAGFQWWEDGECYTIGNSTTVRELPDFLHSLDAQAKWLWPKLELDGYALQLYLPVGYIEAFISTRSAPHWQIRKGASSPAEACAEAILSLIGDGE